MENIGVFLFDAQDLSFSLFLFILRINRIVIKIFKKNSKDRVFMKLYKTFM